jgi:eukaryotic-like serine/threonine-protein kinase
VLGLDSNEARTRLEKAGLSTRMLRTGSTDEQDWIDGVVTQQLPAAGTVVVAGTRVKLTVETRTVAMPDLLGKPLAEATRQLNQLGLRRSEEIAQVVNLKVRAGIVLGQSAPAGQRMAVGATVQLRVASAPRVKAPPEKAP